MSNGSDPDFPLKGLLGMTIDVGDGKATASIEIGPVHLNPHGVVHGAVPFLLIDTAMGAATMSVLDEGLWCTTVDITTHFLTPCFGGTVTATATVRRAGRRLVFLDALVTGGETGDEPGEYVSASGVFAVIPAQPT